MGTTELNDLFDKAMKSNRGWYVNVQYFRKHLPGNLAGFSRSCGMSHSWISNILHAGVASAASLHILVDRLDLDPKQLLLFEEQPEEQDEDQRYAIADSLDTINATLQKISDTLYELLKAWEGK